MNNRREETLSRSARLLLWCIPVFLTVHNAEEALTLPRWTETNLPRLRSTFFFFNSLTFSTPQLYLSLLLATLVPLIVTVIAMRKGAGRNSAMLLLTLQAVIGWNAVVPHITGTIVFGMYNPGLITAAVITIPFTFFLFKEMIKSKIIERKEVKRIFLTGGVVYLPLVYLNHLIAEKISLVLF